MTADAKVEQYTASLRALLADPEVHGVLVIATPTGTVSGQAIAQAFLDGRGESKKPVTACLFGLSDLSREVVFLEEHGVPTYTFPEEAVAGLGSLAKYHAWGTRPRTTERKFPVDRAAVARVLSRASSEGQTVLPEYAARELLTAYGIPFTGVQRVRDAARALAAAEALGYPVALKVASPDISHKTEVGGVALGIGSPAQLRAAWASMARSLAAKAPDARIEGFEVEAMVPAGKEVLVGVQRDPGFGPIVVFGMGGIYVEVLQDVTFRLCPVRPLGAQHMVESVRSFPLLKGVRGESPSDLPALYEVIERVSQLATEIDQVEELDINPLIARPVGQGAVAVDARVVLAPSSRSAPRASGGRSDTGTPRTTAPDAARPPRRAPTPRRPARGRRGAR